MAHPPKDDPNIFSPLGQRLLWLEKPGSIGKVIALLVAACVISVAADLFYNKHGHFAEEQVDGFYAIFGFVAFTAVILGARGVRILLGVREDYYGTKAVDQEESYPAEQLEIKDRRDD